MSQHASPVISIVVPTRNRHKYLVTLVQSLLSMESADFEVVVHDNSDEPGGFEAAGGKLGDSRLLYHYNSSPMSMVQNFENALAFANGDYVCMLGDDDGVTDKIIDLARWLKENNIEAAVTPVVTYLWPGVSSKASGNQQTGIIRVPDYNFGYEIVEYADGLLATLEIAGLSLSNIPSVYQGLISRSALDRLFLLAGTRFPGPSPDMANAIGLSAVIERFVRVSFPVVIAGSCPGSGAAEGANHQHHGEISERKFLPEGTADRWPKEVPFFFSGPTLWATTLLEALVLTGQIKSASYFRYDRLYASCMVFTPKHKNRVLEARNANPRPYSSAQMITAYLWVWSLRFGAFRRNIVNRMYSRFRRTGKLDHIGHAILHVSDAFGTLPLKAIPPLSNRAQK